MAHVEDRWMVTPPDGGRKVRGPRYGVGLRWRAVWVEADGTRRRKACATKDEAAAMLEHVGVAQRTGLYVSPADSAVPLREVAERWYTEQLHQRASSRRTIRGRLDLTILPTLGNITCGDLTRNTIQDAVTTWAQSLAPSTVRVAYVYLAGICQLAVDERRLATSPCRRINLPTTEHTAVVPLSVDTVQRLIDASDPHYQPLLVLAAATGMRSGELRGLTWDRITDTPRGAVIRVDRQLTRAASAGTPVWGPTKTASSVRTIGIGPVTRQALGERGTGLVFTSSRGGAITHKVAWQIWRRGADAVGLPGGEGWHELRHHHASVLIAGGASPVAVAHRLGHKDATETLRTYAHLWIDDDDRMRDATDGLVTLAGARRLRAVAG